MKVLYCIALLRIGWSLAQAKKLDLSELMDHCQDRDVAYVKDAVADFGAQAVLEEPKPYGSSCLMNVLFHGSRFCEEWECDRQKNETAVLVKYLLGIGADVNDKFSDGDIPAISVATRRRNIPAMEMLLKYKADTEIADFWGETTIFYTIRDAKWIPDGSSALRLLIKNGANITAQDKKGRTALDVATKYGELNEPVMDLLVRSSAQAKKLDVSKLMDHCQDRDVAYVKDAVADFGAQAVLEEPKPYGSSCLMNVLFHGSRFCKEW